MRKSNALPGVVFLLGIAFLGCDSSHPAAVETAPQRSVAIDLSTLHRRTSGGVQQECVSVVAEAVLRVEGRERGRRAVPPGALMIRFDSVAVDPGAVAFAGSVFSSNNTLLYEGSLIEEIEGDFYGAAAVRLDLQKRDALLQVCPDFILLGRANDFTSGFTLSNKGSEALDVEVIPPEELCDNEPCLDFDLEATRIEPEASAELRVASNIVEEQTFVVQIQSPVGSVAVEVEVEGNQPPVVDNPIPDQELRIGDEPSGPFEEDLTEVFSDPDGDALGFSATSDDEKVATVSVQGGTLTVSAGGAEGTTPITVTAQDGFGGTAQDVFEVTVMRIIN